jgi:hypothetical protein
MTSLEGKWPDVTLQEVTSFSPRFFLTIVVVHFPIFHIFSLFNLLFLHIFHTISHFNLHFFHIFHIFSLFNLLFIHISHIKMYYYYSKKKARGKMTSLPVMWENRMYDNKYHLLLTHTTEKTHVVFQFIMGKPAQRHSDYWTVNNKGRSPYNGRLSDFSFYIDNQISVHRKFKQEINW